MANAAPTTSGIEPLDTTLSPSALVSTAPTKIARVLAYLLDPDQSLMRFEASRLVGDTALNSTISKLANDYGLLFERTPELAQNSWGAPTPVVRYRLPLAQHQRARNVLKMLFSRRSKARH